VNAVTTIIASSDFVTPGKITSGLDALGLRGGALKRRRSVLDRLREEAERVDALADSFRMLSNEALQGAAGESRQWFRRQDGADGERLFEACAIREAAERKLGPRPFVVQLMGAPALRHGYLAEMATGEGKTLSLTGCGDGGWTRRLSYRHGQRLSRGTRRGLGKPLRVLRCSRGL
jgi:preprotein translocase subunit SecA